ncbi:gliding motility-associated C-terminal domain-containing protein [Chryseobacterium sp. SL1]|uniref:gliding motility-associated C-terminal domain-containing protein n=1 Tax=Chryseobacterium sp. SL1 TaxID=2995159 RepID=UPI002272E677|nr:gliding motility-associated C-terminal domain-containing protein [Chryseobacterium sp. SL1]MCY1662630.1 gliding motility-associated C-terminal domain-containing protein [Chryseobacterium sp. SL1]
MQLQASRDRHLSQAGIFMKRPAVFFLFMLFSLTTKAADLYWVGGSGQWTDINHWSLSSGNKGASLSPSIPQAGDNVIFDSGSGFTSSQRAVFVNQESSCYNLTVKGTIAPFFSGTTLNLYGSAELMTGTVLNNTIYCKASGNATINFNDQVSGQAAFFFMGAGSYTLKGKLKGTGKIYFLKGALNFGSSNITTGFFDEGGCCGTVPQPADEARTLDLGSSVITLTDRNPQSSKQSPSWAYTGSTLVGGSSHIIMAKGADDGYGVFFYGKANHLYHHVDFTNTASPISAYPSGFYQVSGNNVGFNKLTFASSGYISTSSTIDTLQLATSKTYYLSGVQKIGVIQNPTTACDKPWILSRDGTAQATIASNSPIHLINAALNGIKAAGSGSFTVTNGVDAGDNTGWSFMTVQKNLYWIGGGGNWEDPRHWTLYNNGMPSGGCSPTRNDNVFFNQYSGTISSADPVLINSAEAECHTISWSGVAGTPVFKTSSAKGRLSIFGSSTWQQGMTYQVARTRYCGIEMQNTINSNGVNIQGDTYFTSTGKWMLTDAFKSPENDLIFSNGHLDTHGQTVTVRNFASVNAGSAVRSLTLKNSTINIAGNWNYVSYGGPAIYLDAGQSQINMTAPDSYFYYDSGLTYHNIDFKGTAGNASLASTLYSTKTPALFNMVSFRGNGLINIGSNPTPIYIDTLGIAVSKKYVLGTNMEIRIGKLRTDASACGSMMEIGSYLPGTQAKLNLLTPTSLSNAKVSDINAIGAAISIAGGIDGGNNQNLMFSPLQSRNFYWTGGSGNWSDPGHWTLRNENGSVTSTDCLPTSIADVFFDRNSGVNYTVTLDIPAHCHTMTWLEVQGSTPVLKGLKYNPLSINGSLVLQTGMDFDVERTNFVGNATGNTIATHQVVMDYTGQNTPDKGVFFNGIKGSWSLTDTFKSKNFGVINGIFNTNDETVIAENYISEYASGETNSTLALGSSTVWISGYWDASRLSNLYSGLSTINMTGLMPQANSPGGGISTNEFRSGPGYAYHNLNFSNSLIAGKILGSNELVGTAFNNVTFAGESSINGSNQFNSLTLAAGKNSHLMPGSTQTVNRLVNNSSCGSWTLDNNGSFTKATIRSTADISLSHVRICGINVVGGAVYTAKGIDLGNNSGWKFLAPTEQNLYWIGSSGNWSDPNHWTTDPKGTPSGGCVPTRFDKVFFTRYSGESPAIHTDGTAEFSDMTWNNVGGTPSITGTLNCYGSLTLQSSLSHRGGINFLSAKDCTITTNGAILANNFDVNFSGSGTYTLIDDMTTNSRINFTKGTLNTNGKTVTALSFNGHETDLNGGEFISLLLGSSRIFLSDAEGWTYTGTRLDAGKSHIFLIGSASHFKGNDGAVYPTLSFDGTGSLNKLYGAITLDTLQFSARNSTYQLQSGKTVTVRTHLQMSGNNCSTVNIASTVSGIPAGLCVKNGTTTFNFISIRDINASCLPLTILAQSTDLGNNTNIGFLPRQTAGIGVLGMDTTICAAQLPLILDGSALMPNDDTLIQWTNISSGEILGTEIKQVITKGGRYRIKAMYGENCMVTDDITVTVDPVVALTNQITITHPTCVSPLGSISIKTEGGLAYSVDGNPYSGMSYFEIFSGKHSITAKNKAGCISDTTWVTINPLPPVPTAKITYGSPEFHAKGSVDAIVTGQAGGTYKAFPSGLALDQATGTIDLENSRPGQRYTVSYTFTNGSCSSSVSTTIKINPSQADIAYPLLDYCAVGEVNMIRKGPDHGKYTATPDGLKIDETTGRISLSQSRAGLFLVTYTYKDGTETGHAVTTIKINALPTPVITSVSGTSIIKGQTLTLTASGGESYAWIGPEIMNGQNSETISVRPKQTSTYTVIGTSAEGCTGSTDILIEVKADPILKPNNVITPNGDGKNDTWIIGNIENYPNNKVSIYDRAGRLIYTKKGYANDWGGTLNGKVLNEDAYIFVIRPGDGTALIRGTLSIISDIQ